MAPLPPDTHFLVTGPVKVVAPGGFSTQSVTVYVVALDFSVWVHITWVAPPWRVVRETRHVKELGNVPNASIMYSSTGSPDSKYTPLTNAPICVR